MGLYMLPGEDRPHGVKNLGEDFLSNEELSGISRAKFDEFLIKRRGCDNCSVRCGGHFKVKDVDCEGIQANSVRAFGTNLGIHNAEDVLYAHALANLYGLDSDQISASVAWAMDCFEKGIIDKTDTDGLELRFGQGESAAKLIKMVANRQGLGDLLAEGVQKASEKLGRGSEKLAAVVKGNSIMEAAMRTHRAWALGVVTSARGTGHLRGSPGLEFQGLSPEESQRLFNIDDISDPTSYENKAAFVVWQEQYKVVVDIMGICALISMWMDKTLFQPKDMAGLFGDITGIEYSPDELMAIGEKVNNLEKCFNILHTGFDRDDDLPPKKFVDVPVNHGKFKDQKIDLDQWNRMLDEYYKLHGWDEATGKPTKERLEELDLDFVIEKFSENNIELE
jgi:aldehyde:ferredoxin oxidoreductase